MQKVVDTIKIEKLEGGAFNVVQGDRYSDQLGYDEMLGLVSALTIAKEPNCLCWMRTKEEHEGSRPKLDSDITEVEFEDILVPESVEIYRLSKGTTFSHDNGDGLYITFNGSKQVLFYSDGVYGVMNLNEHYLAKVQCKLIPCNRDELKVGDTAFADLLDNTENNTSYCKVLDGGKIVYPTSDYGASITEWKGFNMQWYKVIPV